MGFVVAAIAFLNPFIDIKPDYKYPETDYAGLELAVMGLFSTLGPGPLDPRRYVFVIAFVAAVGGILYRRPGRVGPAVRLSAAFVGVGALAVGHTFSPTDWAYGFFVAEAGFLVAALAAITSLIGAIRLGRSSSSQDVGTSNADA